MTDETGTIPADAAGTDFGDDGLLMRLYDGELEGDELALAQGLVEDDQNAQDKIASMAMVGSFLRECVDADERGDVIADAVMARIEAGAHENIDDGAEPDPPTEAMPNVRLGAKSSANDNARAIFAVAGLAAAVAFGMFFWGGSPTSSGPVAEAPDPLPTQPAAEVAFRDQWSSASAEPPQSEIEEYEPTVEVASVDFGSKSGSVFYVPSGEPGEATTVVWVSDLEEEEEL